MLFCLQSRFWDFCSKFRRDNQKLYFFVQGQFWQYSLVLILAMVLLVRSANAAATLSCFFRAGVRLVRHTVCRVLGYVVAMEFPVDVCLWRLRCVLGSSRNTVIRPCG